MKNGLGQMDLAQLLARRPSSPSTTGGPSHHPPDESNKVFLSFLDLNLINFDYFLNISLDSGTQKYTQKSNQSQL